MVEYKKIGIDFDVYKAIIALLESPDMTENDVLRKLLGLAPSSQRTGSGEDWNYKNVKLKNGTKLRARFKGILHNAEIRNGRIYVAGNFTSSPTEAAKVVTGGHRNGWTFWEYQNPSTGNWHSVDELRQDNS